VNSIGSKADGMLARTMSSIKARDSKRKEKIRLAIFSPNEIRSGMPDASQQLQRVNANQKFKAGTRA
jgi:hypothetical protein